MADSKPIGKEQVYDPKLFDPLKKGLQDVDNILQEVNQQLKKTVELNAEIAKTTPLDSYKNIEKVEKSITETTKAVEELDKIDKDRIKLQQRLAELDDERVKANFNLKEQIRLQTKELRDNAKALVASNNAYEKLKNQTNAAQLNFKRLAAEFGENSTQAKAAQKEFNILNDRLERINKSAKDGRRDVGRYEKGVKGLSRTFKAFASATVILKILELFQNSISQNSEGVAAFEKIFVRFTTVIEVFARRIVEVFPVIQARVERFFIGTQLSVMKLTDLFSDNEDETEKLQKRYDELSKDAGKDLGAIFNSLGNEIFNLTQQKIALIDQTLKYRKEIVDLNKDIADLIPRQAKLTAAFEDDSSSIEEQIRAGIELQKVLQQRFNTEEEIASKRLVLAQRNAQANAVNVDAQEELAEATIAYNELIAQQTGELAANEREIQKLRDDATQLNLDFYVDDAQNRIDTNQRIIDDETQTFERRRQLLEQNGEEIEKANDLRAEALNKSLRERGKAELDFEELRKKQSSEEIARVIRESGISEPLAIRALEIIRERRTELQDNAEAQRDLNAAEAESIRLQSDVLLQQEAINNLQEKGVDLEMVLETLSNQRLQNDIDNLKIRLGLAEEGSAEFININQELNDKLLEQNQKRLEKEKEQAEQQKKIYQDIAEGANEAFQLLNDISDEQNAKRLASIDKEINAEQERLNTLNQLAAEGNEEAEKNLALTEQRQAELELKRQIQIERQQRQELAFAAIQTYSGKVQAGEENPLASTISDIAVLRAFINALPGFYEGSERVGDDLNAILPGKDGHIIRVDGGEKILKPSHAAMVPKGMSNFELARLAADSIKPQKSNNYYDMTLVNELRELKQVTKEKPVYLGSDYDKIADAVVSKIKKGTTLETRHKKNSGIWG